MKIQMTGIEVNELPYERQTMKHIVSLLKNPRTIIDVGANIGWYSIILSLLYPKSKIFAFEPIPQTYNHLMTNIYRNFIYNIYAFNFALLNEAKSIIFNYFKGMPAASSIKKIIIDKSLQIRVNTQRLDDLVPDMKNVDFMKIDTEGSELMVLQGAVETIKKYHPIIQCEMLRKWTKMFKYHPDDIIKFMKKLGYKCYALGIKMKEIKKVTDKTEETNFVFVYKK